MPSKKPVKSIYAPFYDCPPPLKEFLTYSLTIRGLSPKTVDAYYIEIRTFFRFLIQYRENNVDIESFDSLLIKDISNELICSVKLTDIYSYLEFTSSVRGNSSAARARKLCALNSFYNYLTKKTLYLSENPLKNIDRPAIKKSLPKYLTLKESEELLSFADDSGDSRNYCILTLFLNCGMRLSELTNINVSDIRNDRSLVLLGKGNKERVVYLNDACISAVETYREDTKEIRRNDDALFVGKNGKRLSPRRIEQLVKEALNSAGLSSLGYTPHKLRHTAATLMYQYGNVDVRILKEILGHSNLSTTEIYTHVSNRQLEEAMFASPLASSRMSNSKKNSDDAE